MTQALLQRHEIFMRGVLFRMSRLSGVVEPCLRMSAGNRRTYSTPLSGRWRVQLASADMEDDHQISWMFRREPVITEFNVQPFNPHKAEIFVYKRWKAEGVFNLKSLQIA